MVPERVIGHAIVPEGAVREASFKWVGCLWWVSLCSPSSGYGISLIDMGGVDATDEVAASLLLEFDAEGPGGLSERERAARVGLPGRLRPAPRLRHRVVVLHRQSRQRGRAPLRLPVHPLPPLHRASDARRRLRMAQRPGVHGALHG